MVKIKGKVFKIGSSYAMTIPKALIDAQIIAKGQHLELEYDFKDNPNSSGNSLYTFPSGVSEVEA